MSIETALDYVWAVCLINKHTRDEIILGMRYGTREEAEAHATDEHVCLRCNNVRIVRIPRGE